MAALAHSKLSFLSVFCNQPAHCHFMLCPKIANPKVGCDMASHLVTAKDLFSSFNFRMDDELHLLQMLILHLRILQVFLSYCCSMCAEFKVN